MVRLLARFSRSRARLHSIAIRSRPPPGTRRSIRLLTEGLTSTPSLRGRLCMKTARKTAISMALKAFVFDFNGVIVNDEPLHCRAFQEVLRGDDLELSAEEYFETFMPYDDYNFFVQFFRSRGVAADESRIHVLMKRKSEHYFELVTADTPVIQATVDFIRGLPRRMPAVIASGAAKAEIEFLLGRIGLRDRFEDVIAAGDVAHSKPHPEAFLKAFGILSDRVPQLRPADVAVFEDSYRGVTSAVSTGMHCIALTTSYPAEKLAGAHLVLASLDGWTVEKLEAALDRQSTG